MGICVRALAELLVEMGDERVGVACDRRAVLEQRRGDLVGAGLAAHLLEIGPLGGPGTRDEGHPSSVKRWRTRLECGHHSAWYSSIIAFALRAARPR
jgi:hypothetical protein